MNRTIVWLFLVALVITAGACARNAFTVTSDDIAQGQPLSLAQVFNDYGCTGENLSPHLRWSGAPAGSKSFAVTAFDPDAPTGDGFWHWVVFNIPAETTELPAAAGDPASGQLPAQVVQSMNSAGFPGFVGACPPEGQGRHRYQFTVYALDVERLELDADASPEEVSSALAAHEIGESMLEAFYER
jgi:hypothetical protein